MTSWLSNPQRSRLPVLTRWSAIHEQTRSCNAVKPVVSLRLLLARDLETRRGESCDAASSSRCSAERLRGSIASIIDRHKTLRTSMRQWERDGSCFDHLSPCLSQFYCWVPRQMRHQRRGYASGGIFTTAEADFTTTESTRKQVPCGPGERSRQNHMGQELPPMCIRPAIRFIASTPPATRAGVVSSVVVRAIPSKKAMTASAG
jgi:hypothetical protein